jgi:hypothetical protein
MKTKVDYTVSLFCFILSGVFFIPLYKNEILWHTKMSLFLICCGFILLFLSLMAYQYFVIDNKQIKKYSFLGVFQKTYSFNKIASYKNKNVNMDMTRNPINLLYLTGINVKKYLVFNILRVKINNGSVLKIDERFMSKQDFILIKKKIKQYRKS